MSNDGDDDKCKLCQWPCLFYWREFNNEPLKKPKDAKLSGLRFCQRRQQYDVDHSPKTTTVLRLLRDNILQNGELIVHVGIINILTRLRGFQDKLPYLVLFSLYKSLLWELRDKRNSKNLKF